MRLIGLAVIFTFSLALAPLVAEAQQPSKVPRIGYLSADSHATARHLVGAFRQGLRDLGYVEGKNIIIEYRFAEGKYDRLPDLATELVSRHVDVIVVFTIPATRAGGGGDGRRASYQDNHKPQTGTSG